MSRVVDTNSNGKEIITPLSASFANNDITKKMDEKYQRNQNKKNRRSFSNSFNTKVSFLTFVIIPTLLVALYYTFIASDQYRSETMFTIRGTQASPLAELGMSALPGATAQSGDSYVITEYIKSRQLLDDIKNKYNVNIKDKYAYDNIDFFYRVNVNDPDALFIDDWRWMSSVDFNSTTGVVTLNVNAFTPEDAKEITGLVVQASNDLVNGLSNEAKQQIIQFSNDEVARTRKRLNEARLAVENFRNREQILNVTDTATSEQKIIDDLLKQEVELQSRKKNLEASAPNSPTIKNLDIQIATIKQQIINQRMKVGSGSSNQDSDTLSVLATRYQELVSDQEFAEKAYNAALVAYETASQEARKQERYLAVIMEPTTPDYAEYPYRFLNILMAFAFITMIWVIVYSLYRNIKDHTR